MAGDEEMEELVEFIEDIDGAEGYGFCLSDGRVDVAVVLRTFSATSISVKREEPPRVQWRALQPRKEDSLSTVKFRAGSSHVIRPTRASVQARSGAEICEALNRLFLDDLRDSRQRMGMPPRRQAGAELPPVLEGTGHFLTLKGRTETLKHLILSAGRIFATFMNTQDSLDDFLQRDFIMMVVGYPGVGKTTVGSCLSELLLEYWVVNKDNPEFNKELGESLTDDLLDAFKKMISNVVQSGKEVRMYHFLETTLDGHLLWREDGLHYEQIMALRCLHAAVSRMGTPDYDACLQKLDDGAPGLKHQLRLDDVIAFIRQGLGFPTGQRIFLSWYFDGANRASKVGEATWLQHMSSAYVSWFKSKRASDTLVLFTAATTQYSAASLAGTSTGKAQMLYIPLPPLTNDDVYDIVQVFFDRVASSVRQGSRVELSNEWKKVLRFAGGNPRMVSFLLSGLVSRGFRAIPLEELNMELQKGLVVTRARAMVENASNMFVSQSSGFYLQGSLMLKAIYISQLGTIVRRAEKVWDGRFEDTWGDLESQGIVGLVEIERGRPARPPQKASKVSSGVTANALEFRVRYSPIAAYSLLLVNTIPKGLWPDLTNDSWAVKEDSDVLGLVFMLWLKTHLDGGQEFKLSDIIPSHSSLNDYLDGLNLQLPSPPKELDWTIFQPEVLPTSRAELLELMARHPEAFIFSLKNKYEDTIIRVQNICNGKAPQDCFILIESKCKWNNRNKSVSPGCIMENVCLNIQAWGLKMEEVIHIYWPDDWPDEKTTLQHAEVEGWTLQNVIFGSSFPSESPFELLTCIRHILAYFAKKLEG